MALRGVGACKRPAAKLAVWLVGDGLTDLSLHVHNIRAHWAWAAHESGGGLHALVGLSASTSWPAMTDM